MIRNGKVVGAGDGVYLCQISNDLDLDLGAFHPVLTSPTSGIHTSIVKFMICCLASLPVGTKTPDEASQIVVQSVLRFLETPVAIFRKTIGSPPGLGPRRSRGASR